MESSKWLWGGIGFRSGMGYTLAYFVYQIGRLLTTGSFGTGVIPGLIAVALMAGTLVYLIHKQDEK